MSQAHDDLGDDWVAYAACHGRSSLFFAGDQFSQEVARRVCMTCAVLPQCLDFTRRTEPASYHFGVAAGLLPEERARWDRRPDHSG